MAAQGVASPTPQTVAPETLPAAFRARIGADHVRVGEDDGMDLHVWAEAVPPLCVARPGSATEVAAVIRLAATAGVSIVPRGAGLSYTAGTVCADPHVTLDTGRLDHVSIHADDLYVVVGAGCTWDALATALRPHRLRVPIAAPISGDVSTIGGALSQNLPGSMDAVLGLRVVLADGSLLTTGSAALRGRAEFWRHAGPDLTGLFLGDCGALGVKTEVVLRLSPEPHAAFASFAFADPLTLVGVMGAVQRADPGAVCMALDPQRASTAMRGVGPVEAARIALALLRHTRSPLAGVVGLLRARIRPGRDWALHVTVESASAAGAAARIAALRALVVGRGGAAIGTGVPAAVRSRPFSVRGALGPVAERWVPVHGLVPLSAAPDALRALLAHVASNAAELREANISIGWLLSARAGHVLFEPMLLWPDALGTQHLRHLPSRVTARAAAREPMPRTRAAVDQLRAELRDILDAHGAVHLQIGRYYNHADALDPAARGMLVALKQILDPTRRLNPGSLGL